MNTNPYAPPTAVVVDIPDTSVAAQSATPFFAVSVWKLGVLSLCTLGVYPIYWFYKNWQLIRDREQSSIIPFWRALFGVLFCYSCFRHIRDHGTASGVTPPLLAGPLAIGWIITTITWKLPDPYWLISLLAVVFVLPVQAYVNRVNEVHVPSHDPNAQFSALNWVAVVAGGFLLGLAIVGTFIPELYFSQF